MLPFWPFEASPVGPIERDSPLGVGALWGGSIVDPPCQALPSGVFVYPGELLDVSREKMKKLGVEH